MLVVPIPTERYLACVVDAAKSAGYEALLVVLVRSADAPKFHASIIKQWASLHDVTGDFMAVLCPDPRKALHGECADVQGVRLTGEYAGYGVGGFGLQVRHTSAARKHAYYQSFGAIGGIIAQDELDEIRRGIRKFGSVLPTDGGEQQLAAFTEAVRRCSVFFGIGEDQLPALLFLCFADQTAVMVKPKENTSLYQLSKSVAEGISRGFQLQDSIAAAAAEQLGDVDDAVELDNRGALASWRLRTIGESSGPGISGSKRRA